MAGLSNPVDLLGKVISYPQTFIGNYIRDSLFLPDPKLKFPQNVRDECWNVFNPEINDPDFYPNKNEVLKLFKQREEWIEFTYDNKKIRSKVLILETNFSGAKETHTCIRMGGGDEEIALSPVRIMPFLSAFQRNTKNTDYKKNLRFIQVSLHDNEFEKDGGFQKWKPAKFEDMGKVFFAMKKELEKKFIIDSLICHSMGGAILEHLKSLQAQEVPHTIILDRSIPSVWKVGRQLMDPVRFYIVYFLAYCTGWTGYPEYSLVNFFEKFNYIGGVPLDQREVIILEADHDFYFSGNNAFDRNLMQRLKKCGARVFRQSFFPNPFKIQYRAHHALPINYLRNTNSTTSTTKSNDFIFEPNQDAASFIVKNIFMGHMKKE